MMHAWPRNEYLDLACNANVVYIYISSSTPIYIYIYIKY